METLAERVSGLLERRGLSNVDAAERAGLSRSHVSQIARGALTNPALDTLRALAKALETSVSYLVGDTDNPLPVAAEEWMSGEGALYVEMARRAYEAGVPVGVLAGIVAQLRPLTLAAWVNGEGVEYAEVAKAAQEAGVSPQLLRSLVEQLRK